MFKKIGKTITLGVIKPKNKEKQVENTKINPPPKTQDDKLNE